VSHVLGSYEARTQFSIRTGYSTLMEPGHCSQRLSLRRSRNQSMYGFACLPACLLATASHHPSPLSVSSYGLFNFCMLCNDLALQYTSTTLQRSSAFHGTPHHVSVSYDVYTVNIHRSSVLRHTTVWQISKFQDKTLPLYSGQNAPPRIWSPHTLTPQSLVRRNQRGGMRCLHLQGRSFIRHTG
jgi:hypothetical protein